MGAKLNYIILGTSFMVGVVLRVCMLLFTINHQSGFIEREHIITAVFIILFMIVAAILVVVSTLTQKSDFKIKHLPLISAVTNLLLAAAIVYEVLLSNILDYAPNIQKFFHRSVGILAAAALVYMAVCYFTKTNYPKIITALPVVFWITRVVVVFSEFAALATVSDTVIETIAMCLALFVFLDNGKIECDVAVKNRRLTRVVATLCGYACLVSSLPRLICLFASPEALTYFANIPPFTALSAAFFSVVFALKIKTEE